MYVCMSLTDFHLDLQSSRPQQSVVDQVFPVRHPYQQDVVQLLHSVNLHIHQGAGFIKVGLGGF